MDLKFTVRWKDDKGEERKKIYDTEAEANNALSWLVQRGVADCDIAVSLPIREEVEEYDITTSSNNQ